MKASSHSFLIEPLKCASVVGMEEEMRLGSKTMYNNMSLSDQPQCLWDWLLDAEDERARGSPLHHRTGIGHLTGCCRQREDQFNWGVALENEKWVLWGPEGKRGCRYGGSQKDPVQYVKNLTTGERNQVNWNAWVHTCKETCNSKELAHNPCPRLCFQGIQRESVNGGQQDPSFLGLLGIIYTHCFSPV